MQGFCAVWWTGRGRNIAPYSPHFHLTLVKKHFRFLNSLFNTATHGIFIAKSPPRLAPEWSFVLPKIDHLIRDFMVCLVSGKLVLDLCPNYPLHGYK